MTRAEKIIAELELVRDTVGPMHAALQDEIIRASMVWGPDNDPNPFYGKPDPIELPERFSKPK